MLCGLNAQDGAYEVVDLKKKVTFKLMNYILKKA
jgi:hypothetical protein